MNYQTCDFCDQFSSILLDYYGQWTCQECMSNYGLEQEESAEWMFVSKPSRSKVTIEEIEGDYENLGLNAKSINYCPSWEQRDFGPCKVSVEFLEQEYMPW